jgi:hypothetical protein
MPETFDITEWNPKGLKFMPLPLEEDFFTEGVADDFFAYLTTSDNANRFILDYTTRDLTKLFLRYPTAKPSDLKLEI